MMAKAIVSILTMVFLIAKLSVTSALYTDHIKIRKMLLSPERYDPLIRPVNDTLDPVLFNLKASFHSVEIQEDEQTMTMYIWTVITWKDDFLRWNSTEYGGVDKIDIKYNDIWKPYLSIYRSVEDNEIRIHEDTLFNVQSDGLVKLQMGFKTKTQCDMDIAKFPFEVQNCDFYIIGTYMMESEMKFNAVDFSGRAYTGSQWEVLDFDAKIGTKFRKSIVTFSLTVKRLPDFYVITIVIPLLVTAVLSPLVLLIPPSSGELVSVAITILLSYTVFLNMLSGILPESSTSISLLSVYIMIIQALSALYTTICIVLVKMDTLEQGNQTLREWLFRKCGRVRDWKQPSTSGDKNSGIISKVDQLNRILFFVCFTVSLIFTMFFFGYILS